MTIMNDGDEHPRNALTAVSGGVTSYLPLKGLIDVEKESARLKKELENIENEIKRTTAKLNNENFTAKAPAAVVEKEKAKKEEAEAKRGTLIARMEQLKAMA